MSNSSAISGCMVVFSHFPADPRVRREAESMVGEGYRIEVICLCDKNENKREVYNGIHIHRLPIKRRRGSKGRYLYEYLLFLILSFLTVSRLYAIKRYRFIHVHNMPDILVLCALIPKLFGAKLILDLHDPMPEVFMAKYNLSSTHWLTKTLIFFERISVRMSDLVFTPNVSFKKLFVSRSCKKSKVRVVMNSPQESVFRVSPSNYQAQRRTQQRQATFNLMYHGTIVERHGLHTVLEAVEKLQYKIPQLRLDIFGDGDFVEVLIKLVEEKSLGNIVKYHGLVSLEKIAAAIPECDLGVIPNKLNVFTEVNLPTRIFEYLCMCKPVIVPRTQGIKDYFDDESIFYFNPGDAESLAETIERIFADSDKTRNTLINGVGVYKKYQWKIESEKMLAHLDALV